MILKNTSLPCCKSRSLNRFRQVAGFRGVPKFTASNLPTVSIPELWENTSAGPFQAVQVGIHPWATASGLIQAEEMETSFRVFSPPMFALCGMRVSPRPPVYICCFLSSQHVQEDQRNFVWIRAADPKACRCVILDKAFFPVHKNMFALSVFVD